MPHKLPPERIQKLLLDLVEKYDDEDREVRERQILKARRLKFMWDNIFQIWYSETAHDWRVFDAQADGDGTTDQAYYDKPVNVFRAYIESVIAALSVTTPAAKCFPEDADSTLDLITARAGDKIGELIGRHNNVALLWLRALYVFYTEGPVFGYSHAREDKKYGTWEEDKYEEVMETREVIKCPTCGQLHEEDQVIDAAAPEQQAPLLCPTCGNQGIQSEMIPMQESFPVNKVVGKTTFAKSRVCLEVYGSLNVKIDNNAKKAYQTPYLIYSYETHYTNAIQEYEHLGGRKKELLESIRNHGTGPDDPYTQWSRLNTLYYGDYPRFVVTMRKCWLRPAAFNGAPTVEESNELKKLYPRGVKVCLVNDEFGEAEEQDLDDYWSISENPMEDYLTHDPQGISLVSGQEITNDIISLVLQTIEHGIGQTFADPSTLDFDAYRNTEAIPGGVYEAAPKSGKSLSESFFELKTATLSQEVMPFFEMIQGLLQLVSGALPSLFGGDLEGSKTASQYSMSRAQALQRLQNTWKLFTSWWREVNGKAIPMFINNMKTDEKDVQLREDGSFFNVFIRKAELEGKIGKIELEAAENLPQTWMQKKDAIMKIMEMQNEQLISMLMSPENMPLLKQAIGLDDFYVPGEDQRNKQNDEIKELLASAPMVVPPPVDESTGIPLPDDTGQPMAETEEPSVEIDPVYDMHPIHFETVQNWAVSEAGRQAKIDNPQGYKNVLLHGMLHFQQIQQQMMQQAMAGAENPEKPTPEEPNAINGEADVNTVA